MLAMYTVGIPAGADFFKSSWRIDLIKEATDAQITSLEHMIQELQKYGIVVIASAGNEGEIVKRQRWPW